MQKPIEHRRVEKVIVSMTPEQLRRLDEAREEAGGRPRTHFIREAIEAKVPGFLGV